MNLRTNLHSSMVRLEMNISMHTNKILSVFTFQYG